MRAFLTCVAAVTVLAGGAVAATAAPEHSAKETARVVAKGLANPTRAAELGDDARRKAKEVLVLSGVGRGDRVIDFIPGAGYWTRIFAGAVGPAGKVYALWPKGGEKYAEKPLPALKLLPNVVAEVQTTPLPALAEPVDIFWTVQNYHDIANFGGEPALAAFNAAVLKTLKPGGVYIVIDHADAAGTALAGTETRHRIDAATVKAQVVKAGFEFVGESTALANPADDHSKTVFDPLVKGRTDQFVYKFRKPL